MHLTLAIRPMDNGRTQATTGFEGTTDWGETGTALEDRRESLWRLRTALRLAYARRSDRGRARRPRVIRRVFGMERIFTR
ncbi:hypothetical protein PCAR4_180068 [Paraburkholderia caribensis]|nr:hypothetical protein PCAR4_180068 [Paraburkholderia caribensis]